MPGPFDEQRHAKATFPGCALFAAEGSIAAVGPHHELVAVVGGVDNDGVVGDAELIELLEDARQLVRRVRASWRERRHSSERPSSTAIWMYLLGACDQMWIAVVLNQTKKGLSLLPFRSM